MTSLDEALRALEKEMREYANEPVGLPRTPVDALIDGWADRLAAILSARQEVAPVAWGLMYPDDHAQRGQLWNVAVEKESAEQMQSACWNAGYDVIVPLYASPAHTSKARDAAALAAFTEYFVKNYPGPNTIISNPNWHAPKIFRAAKYAIDASMRQEAE